MQVGGLSLAGSTRSANTLRLCAVSRLKKRGRRGGGRGGNPPQGHAYWQREMAHIELDQSNSPGPAPGGQLLKCARLCVDLPAQCVTAKWRLWLSHYTPRMATKQLKKGKAKQAKTARYFFSCF